MHQTLEKSMFFLLLKKNYSISILHGSESLPVVVITIHPPKGRQATPKGQPKDGEVYFPSLSRGVQRHSLWQGQLITDQRWQPTCCQSLYGSPGASWQDKRSGTRCLHLVYLVCQICGCDTVSGMPNRGLKGAKAPSQVSKVSRQAITLGNLQSTDKTYEVCL